MKVRATASKTYPAGCHWSVGKVRNIELADGEELPSWLVSIKDKKSKSKKADTPKADDEG